MAFARVLARVNDFIGRTGATLAVAILVAASGAAAQQVDPPLDVLMRATDDAMRGDSSESRITMRIKTERWQRELRLHVVSEGTETALVRIEAPAKERGTATLKVEQNIWNYLPKVDRTIKVPGSMMQAAWMGSHFTNDDLVHESRYSEDFECAYRERPSDGSGHWLVRCVPLPDAPVVWGAIDARFRAQDMLLDQAEYFDERDRLVRTIRYEDFGPLGGRTLPRRLRVIPADSPFEPTEDEPEEFTEIVYEEHAFDVDLPPGTFSLRSLRQ